MADINKLKDKIKSTIYPNGKGAINASDHQAMLLDMADGMADTDTKLAELSEEISNKVDLTGELVKDYIYVTDNGVGKAISLTPSKNIGWSSAVIDCKGGDEFYYNATGGGGARGWCFVDSANICLSVAPEGARNERMVAPTNAAKLIVNINTNYAYIFEKIEGINNRLATIEGELNDVAETLGETNDKVESLNASLGMPTTIERAINAAADVIQFPFVAKKGDTLNIKVSAPNVISSSPSLYEPIFDSNSTYLETVHDGANINITLPNDTAFIKIVGRTDAFIKPGIIKMTITNNSGLINKVEGMDSNPKVLLPSTLTAVVGREFNIYFDSIILAEDRDAYEKQWAGGFPAGNRALAEGLRFTPTATSSANISLTLRHKVKGEEVAKVTSLLKVIADAPTDKKIIFIGDSLTDAGYYAAEIQHNLSEGKFVSLGTRSSNVSINGETLSVNHEGRSGWSAQNYTSAASYNGMANAFYNPSSSKFDFAYYMGQKGYADVDVVCICLGTNGYTTADAEIAAIQQMIASIHAYNSSIKILVSMITPPSTQDGVGYRTAYTSADASFRNMMAFNEKIYATFNGKTNIGILPWYVGLNRKYDFPTTEEAFSARNPIKVTRQNDNVHPSVYGYLAMADIMYGYLLDL